MDKKKNMMTYPGALGANAAKQSYLEGVGAIPNKALPQGRRSPRDGDTCPLASDTSRRHPSSRGAAGLLGLFADPVNREVSPPPRKATPPIAEPFGGSRTPASTPPCSPVRPRIPDTAFDALAGRPVGAWGGFAWAALCRTFSGNEFKGAEIRRLPSEEWR